MMGRWSELRLVEGDQRAAKARWAEARERSGEEVWPLEGVKVGRGSFRRARELPFDLIDQTPRPSERPPGQEWRSAMPDCAH